jgi:hypothetical protein
VVAYLIAQSASVRDWLRSLLIGATAYAASSPWIPPSTLNAIRTNSYWMSPSNHIDTRQLLYWLPLLVSLLALLYAFQKLRLAPALRFALLLTLFAGWITMAALWFGIIMIPQPDRYHIEVDVALCLLLPFALAGLYHRLPAPVRWSLLIGLVLFGVFQVKAWRRFARDLSRPGDVQATIEYRSSRWLDQHLPNTRVMDPGSSHVFLNAITDVPQLSGGFDQGITNIMVPNTIHLFYKGSNQIDRHAEITILLLKALGVGAIMVGGPNSRDFFRPQEYPERFASSGLPELWREGDDAIYAVPARSSSLAHVVAPEDLVRSRPFVPSGMTEVRTYVAALESQKYPLAEFTWISPHQAGIAAELSRDQVLSVQISYHPGWHARANGEPRRIHEDGLGQMVVDPECAGRCVVDLTYDGGMEMFVAKLISYSTILLAIAWILVSRLRSAHAAEAAPQ